MADQPAEQAHQAAGKLAQLLSQVLIEHTPHTARIQTEEHYRQLEAWLEDLERHTSGHITPFLTDLLASTQVPETLRPIIQEAIDTPAQFSAIVTQLFLYGIVSQLLSTSVQPYLQGVSNDLWTKAVGEQIGVPVSPAVIATAAARGLNLGDPPTVKMPDWAYSEAAKSGVRPEDIDLQASIVGTPPAPQQLFEMMRRGIIAEDRAKVGLAEGDTRDDWIDQLIQLAHGWPTPLDFVRAAVQAQMGYGDAKTWATKTGLDTTTPLPIDASQVGGSDDMFGLLWASAGRPPGPQELARMTLRGIIEKDGTGAGAVTFQQGIAESDLKTKWTEYLWLLAQYLPPPSQVGTLLERGAITREQAVTLWEQGGVPKPLAEGYAFMAEQQHIGQDKLLAKGEVLTAYYDHLVDRETAETYLGLLGYRGETATLILDVQDFKRELQAQSAVVRRISTLYGAHKLTAQGAKEALISVGIEAGQAGRILQSWEVLREQPIRLPTVRAIGRAVKYGTLTEDEAMSELAALGYQPRDAAIELSSELGKPITPLPPAGSTITG